MLVNLFRVDTAVLIILRNQKTNNFKHYRKERGEEVQVGGGSVLRDTTVTIIMTKFGRKTKFIALRFDSSARSSLWYWYTGKKTKRWEVRAEA